MRKFNNKKMRTFINGAGIATFLCGTGEIAYHCINTDMDHTGVFVGLGVAAVGLATHLVMHNIDYRENLEKELKYLDLEEKRNNEFYRNSLLKEQQKLELLDLYLDNIIYKYPSEIRSTIEDDLISDQLLIDKKIEILDFDEEENSDEELDVLMESINYLESLNKSKEYTKIKNKIFNLDNSNIVGLSSRKTKDNSSTSMNNNIMKMTLKK